MFRNLLVITVALTSIVSVTNATGVNTLSGAFFNINRIVQILSGIAYTLVFLAFFWGLARYLLTYSDEKKKNAMHLMIISIAIIFVMTSIWGIVKLIQKTFGIYSGDSSSIRVPMVIPKQ